MILGFLGFILPAAVAAVILGHVSRSEIRKSAGQLQGAGMAMAGLVLGYIGLLVIPFLIVAAIAIPNLLRSRIAANEASAVGAVRTINTAEITYATTYPKAGFTCDLSRLGGRDANELHAGLLDDRLSSGTKNGYRFVITNCDGSNDSYSVVASPVAPGQSGMRTFCSDQSGVIRYASGSDPCDSSSTPLM